MNFVGAQPAAPHVRRIETDSSALFSFRLLNEGFSMDTKGKEKIGIIGSQFQADIHATSLQIMPHEAELVAVASPTPGNAEHFAKRFNIPRAYTDYREMLKDPAIEVISICAPNSLHCQMTKDAAAVG